MQRKVGNFLYFRLLNGMCSVINLALLSQNKGSWISPRPGRASVTEQKIARFSTMITFIFFWKDQVLIIAYMECNHEWSRPGEMNHPTRWTGNWWLKSEIKVKFHNYQHHLCGLSLIGGVQQEDQDAWGAGSATLSKVYTPETFLSLAFAVSRLPTVNLSVFPKSSERSSINCLTTCLIFVMFL